MIPIGSICEAPCVDADERSKICLLCIYFQTPTEKLVNALYPDSLYIACGIQLLIDFTEEMIEDADQEM